MNIESIATDKAPKAIGPYSQAIKAGEYIYVSGQIPINPALGEISSSDIEVQLRQVFENLKNILEAAGSGLNKVIKTTVYLRSLSDFATLNKVYEQYFSEPYPARSCVEVSALPRNALVEIEAVALAKTDRL